MTKKNIAAVLGDSRVFDTYYLNDRYDQGYGYNKTFPHLLRGKLLGNPELAWDVVHIPDHFRGGTTANNILRLALIDPDCVYLCDGIWETLLNKSHFAEYASAAIDAHQTRHGALMLEYSQQELMQLYVDDKLSISPQKYATRIYEIASFFLRRRRACCWMNLIMPDPAYRDGVHYAGNYKCSPYWRDCLQAVNEHVAKRLAPIDGSIMDLHQMMQSGGGEESALLDQWHFTASFHKRIAEAMYDAFSQPSQSGGVPADHVSHRYMVAPKQIPDPVVFFTTDKQAKPEDVVSKPVNVGLVTGEESKAAVAEADVVILAVPDDVREEHVSRLLKSLRPSQIIVFLEEINAVENPMARTVDANKFN